MTSGNPSETTPADAARNEPLAAPHLPSPPTESRWWRILVAAATAALIVGWLIWYMRTPEELPTDATVVTAGSVVDTPVYVGMFTLPDGGERTLSISGIKVATIASADVTVTPLLCRGGAIGVTTDPDQFCAETTDPAGATMETGDSIVLEVVADEPAYAEIDRIEIAFREGLRWGTHTAGHAGAQVTLTRTGS